MSTIDILYKSLNQRKRPEDIAEMILSILKDDLSYSEIKKLKKASERSLKNRIFGYTSMLQEFASVIGAEKQIKKATELFKFQTLDSFDYSNTIDINSFINDISPLIHKHVGENDFKAHRLTRYQRKELGLDISKRQYNKQWRLLKRLEEKLIKTQKEVKKIEFQKIAKHGIAHHLDIKSFKSDINSACFIAYFNSRCNLRSVFTNQSQEIAYDEISDMLFKRCNTKKIVLTSNTTNWLAISHIYSNQKVLSNLTDEQKGILLGKWTNILQEIADLLEEIWNNSTIRRETMIVQRGNDSTTWNNTAGAWNKARDHWMNLIYGLGLDSILNEICFGKVMRLMAADVVSWHYASNGKLDPNTDVWNKIPLPWEVLKGKDKCTKNLVIKHCEKVGLHPEKSGWIAPRKHSGVVKFKPTPELVHGVAISNPFLATLLKREKHFSGKIINFSRN